MKAYIYKEIYSGTSYSREPVIYYTFDDRFSETTTTDFSKFKDFIAEKKKEGVEIIAKLPFNVRKTGKDFFIANKNQVAIRRAPLNF